MASSLTIDQLGISKTWDLSLYELHRTPQEVITDDTEIAVSPRSLHNELMCPICLDMLKKTMTTKECLHRFCSDCIITALRAGNKECPTCRKKLVSKRSLRPDPNFDLLISKIYPSRDEYEANQTKVLEKLNKSHNSEAFVQSINQGIKLQNQNRLQRINKKVLKDEQGIIDSTVPEFNHNGASEARSRDVVKNNNKPGTSEVALAVLRTEACSEESPMESGSTSEGSWYGPSSSDEIDLVFQPHPNEKDSDLMKLSDGRSTRYLKTTVNATMGHLCKYLETRTTIDLGPEFRNREVAFNVHVSPKPGQFIRLGETETLSNVLDKHWRNNKPLDLYYTSKRIDKIKTKN